MTLSPSRPARGSRVAVAAIAAIALIAASLGAWIWTQIDDAGARRGIAVPHSQTPATVTIEPAPDATDVDPLGAVRVSASNGTLAEITMFNDRNKPVRGVMTPDDTAWKPTEPLGYGRTYTLTVASRGDGGTPKSQTSRFTTLTPGNQTKATLTTTSGAELTDGASYGVGTVIVTHFDEPITDRAAAQKRLKVSTKPAVQGSWYWVDDQNAHWRPERYDSPGTTVIAEANIYGAQLGGSLYGQEDSRVSFRIGDSHVSIADDATKQVSVYENGRLVSTMPTSMGMGGTKSVSGQEFSFWTQPGAYTVMDKSDPVVMDSSTFATRAANHFRSGRTAIGRCPGLNGLRAAQSDDFG